MSKSQELFIDGYEWPDEVVVYLTNDDWADARIYLKETDFLEMGVQYSNEQHALQTENAKLRELVRDMWHEGAFEPGACYEKAAERLEERTRELGVEVD